MSHTGWQQRLYADGWCRRMSDIGRTVPCLQLLYGSDVKSIKHYGVEQTKRMQRWRRYMYTNSIWVARERQSDGTASNSRFSSLSFQFAFSATENPLSPVIFGVRIISPTISADDCKRNGERESKQRELTESARDQTNKLIFHRRHEIMF